jgi:hypothetical protein
MVQNRKKFYQFSYSGTRSEGLGEVYGFDFVKSAHPVVTFNTKGGQEHGK